MALLNVTGRDHIGKKTFLNELCYFLNARGKFKFMIMFEDLAKIKNEKHFKDLNDRLREKIKLLNEVNTEGDDQQFDDDASEFGFSEHGKMENRLQKKWETKSTRLENQ